MKYINKALAVALGIPGLGALIAPAAADSFNITAVDNAGSPSRYWNPASGLPASVGLEDNEVEAVTGLGAIRGQMWDLEAFNWNDTSLTLSLISGYDLRNNGSGSSLYGNNKYAGGTPGQLFIKIDPSTSLPYSPTTSTPATVPNSTYGYDYAIDLRTGAYWALTGSTVLDTVTYDAFRSNPWKLHGSPTPTGTTTLGWTTGQTAGQVDSMFGNNGLYDNLRADPNPDGATPVYTHNVMDIDLSFLSGKSSASDNIWFHYTMECGNYMMLGQMQGGFRVPDGGASLLLLGLSFTGLGLISRKVRS